MKHAFRPLALAAFFTSLAAFILCALFLTVVGILSDHPLTYLSGGFWIAFCVILVLNAVSQIPMTVLSRGLATLPPTPGRAALAGILAAAASLAHSVGTVYLAVVSAGAPRITLLLAALFSLIGAVGLALRAVFPGKYPTAEVLTLLPLPLSCVSYALYLYFETTIPKNGSLKLLVSLCFLALALYLITDIRRSVGEPRPRLSLFLARAAAPLLASVSFSALYWKIFRGVSAFGATAYVFLAAFAFYMFLVTCVPTLGDHSPHPLPFSVSQNKGNPPASADGSLAPTSPSDLDTPTPPTDNSHESE